MVTFFEIWVSFKYLLPKTKEKFFSIITIFSFVGISLGVATLIIVMSVMNGFRDELTNKILGVNGHLKVQHFNNLKINNNDSLNEILNKNITGVFVNKIIVSIGMVLLPYVLDYHKLALYLMSQMIELSLGEVIFQ